MSENPITGATTGAYEPDVEPLELVFSPFRLFSNNKPFAYRSFLRINNPQLGTLMPGDYRAASEKTTRGIKLAQYCMDVLPMQMVEFTRLGIGFEWVSMYVPSKMFTNNDVAGQLQKRFEAVDYKPKGRFCIEVGSDILFANSNLVKHRIDALHKIGVKTLVSGYGNEFCPVVRLRKYPFDLVLLDSSMFGSNEPGRAITTRSIVKMSRGMGYYTAACGIVSESLREEAEKYGCDAYADDRIVSAADIMASVPEVPHG